MKYLNIKLDGTFFEFRHHNTQEGKYWNDALHGFSEEQWRIKIREISALGMEYIVLMATALYDKCYFKSSVFPRAVLNCDDPIEVLLDEADKCNIKVFLGNGFYGDWQKASKNIKSPDVLNRSFKAMEELSALYGHHKSFYGWYFPDETCIILNFSKSFMQYVNLCSAKCRELTPNKKTLIAPYGTNLVYANDRFIRSLSELDVDFIAYQDEVGVRKTKVDRTLSLFEKLKIAHDKAGRSKLWADIELFDFEGKVYKSPLLPADFNRIKKQIENVAPYVDKILCYQYPGIMNPRDSEAFSGHNSSALLYEKYNEYLKK